MALVVVTYLMNDTIMTPDDMERKVGLQVLASLPFDEEEDDGVPVKSTKKGKKFRSSHKSSKSSSKSSQKSAKKAVNEKGGK